MEAVSGHFYDNVVYRPSSGFRFFAKQSGSSGRIASSPLVARYNAVFSVREKPSLGYSKFDSFYVLRGSPYFDGNAGAGSNNVGYQFATWNNGADRFYNNSGHAVQADGESSNPNPKPNPKPNPRP